MFLVQVNHESGALDELCHVGADRSAATLRFIEACAERLTNWDEYSADDKTNVLDNGYAEFGGGCVVLIDTDGVTSNDDIASMISGYPRAEKITRWLESGEIGEVETVSELLERAGRCLDSSESHEICGPVLFQLDNGEWHVGTVEFVVGKAHPNYLKDALEAERDANAESS